MRFLLFSSMCFVLITCITPYDPKISGNIPKLVVDGLITDQAGPHQVRLTYSAAYNNEEALIGRFVNDAIVRIDDNTGVKTNLQRSLPGTYETPVGFVGEVGRRYSLVITLSDGREYRSQPEELKFVPPIDTVMGEYRELPSGFLRGEFDLSIETRDPVAAGNFYSYRWVHYEFKPWCSISPAINFRSYVVDCCESCWAIEQCVGCINILSDNFVNGAALKVPIVTIPYDSKEPYFVVVEQRSLTESAYQFWKNVSTQITSSGGIFDRPPVTIRGNMYNVDNPEEQVLGFFGASSVAMKSIHFKRDKVNKMPFGTDIIYDELSLPCVPCEVGAYRTIQTPPGW